jgi:hypothetical protein
LGLDISIPSKLDQLLLLECLIRKKKNGILQNIDDTGYEKVPSKNLSERSLDLSLILMIIDLSKEGVDALLLALLKQFVKPDVAWKFIPKTLQQCGSQTSLPSGSIFSRNKNVILRNENTERNMEIFVGDLVTRGPDWNYGNQDRCLGSNTVIEASEDVATGFVVKVSPWVNIGRLEMNEEDIAYKERKMLTAIEEEKEKEQEREGICVSVQWSHGGVNTYRWGVSVLQSLSHSTENDYSYDLKKIQYDENRGDKKILKYSPGQVGQSILVHTVDISLDEVLEYVKKEASPAWLLQNLPHEGILDEFEIYNLYRIFHDVHGVLFSPKNEVFLFEDIVGGSALLDIDVKDISMSTAYQRILISITQFIEDDYSRTDILNNHAKNGDISSIQASSSITEAANSLLSCFQCLMTGHGEISQENISQLSMSTCENGHRLASNSFAGTGKVPMVWNWRSGSWNAVPKGPDETGDKDKK